jgi:hypothetical protein
MKRNSYPSSQATGSVENAVSLHVDDPCTGGRSSDLLFEAVSQECLQFPYDYFLLVILPFEGYCFKLCHYVFVSCLLRVPLF